jgi:hypothetical protein
MSIGLRRVEWTGAPHFLTEAWRLKKKEKGYVRCIITNHPFGWELRLLHGEDLLRTQVFRESDPLIDAATEWKEKMKGAGWEQPPPWEAL